MGVADKMPLYDKPNKIFQGTETRNDYTNWNVSSQPYSKF
jgi:hypothetical protein